MHQRSITFYEYRGFRTPAGAITDSIHELPVDPEELAALRRLSSQLIPGTSIFEITNESIRARSIVGVFSFADLRIEVLPKLLAPAGGGHAPGDNDIVRNLMFMLTYTNALDTWDTDLATLGAADGDFIESYIGSFARRLSTHLERYGVPKRYVETEGNLHFIKGRIDWGRSVAINSFDQSRSYCAFSEFSEENSVARAFKFVAAALSALTRVSHHDRMLQRCVGLLDGVQARYVEPSVLGRSQHGKRDTNFLGLIQLTKLFLSRLRPDFAPGVEKVFSLMFDMNKLFEEFIFQALHRNDSQLGITVTPQKKQPLVEAVRELLPSGEWQARSHFDTYSDIKVQFDDGSPPLIIDTKYKLIGEGRHFGISTSDAYQILAYQQIHKSRTENPNVLLLYPRFEVALKKAFQVSSSDATFAVATVDLSQDLQVSFSEFLDELAGILGAVSDKRPQWP